MNILVTAIAAALGTLLLVVGGYLWLNRRQLSSARKARKKASWTKSSTSDTAAPAA